MLGPVQFQTLLLVVDSVEFPFDLVVTKLLDLQKLALPCRFFSLPLLGKFERTQGHIAASEGRVNISEVEGRGYRSLAAGSWAECIIGSLVAVVAIVSHRKYSVSVLSDRLQEDLLNFLLQP